MKDFSEPISIAAYVLSALAMLYLALKVTSLRSKCLSLKEQIGTTIEEISDLKAKNNRLESLYFRMVCPSNVDNATKNMRTLHEDEVGYIELGRDK